MTDFLLELYSEEIPAGMQARGVSDLARLYRELLAESGIDAAETSTYVCPAAHGGDYRRPARADTGQA